VTHEVPVHDAIDFDAFLGELLDGAYRLAVVILRDRAAAEDAVQDAMLHAWQARTSLRDPRSGETWFRRILVNSCRDRLRAGRRHPVVDLTLVERPADDDLATSSAQRDELARITRRMEPDDQLILALRYFQDLTVVEIALVLGIAEGTVKSRLHRALERVRAAEASAHREVDR